MVTQQQFKDFLAKIEPSQTTRDNCAKAQSNLRDKLSSDEIWGKKYCLDTLLSGSYKRHTAIRPRIIDGSIQRPDVDIIVITNYSKSDKPKDVLNELNSAIKRIGYSNTKKQNRSVHISLSTVEMDVVPLIAPYGYDSNWFIGDRESDSWIFTDPRKQVQYTTNMNKTHDNDFVPLVKLFKWWRREFPINTSHNHPKGIGMEKIVGDNISDGIHIGETFVLTIEKMVSAYYLYDLRDAVPFIADPGDTSSNLLKGFTSSDFRKFYKYLSENAKNARKAYDSTDNEESLTYWRKIFGQEFPDSKDSSSSQTNTTGFSFPSRQVNPNKPAGFGN